MRILTILTSAILGFLLFPQHHGCGQTVEGRVIDLDGIPISGALVSLRIESGEAQTHVVSDDHGIFSLDSGNPGTYWVLVERLGYQTTQSILNLREGDSIVVELRMAVEAIPMEPIVVTASPRSPWEYTEPPALWEFWERKDYLGKLGIGDFHTYEDLKPLQGSPVALAIIQLTPFLFPRATSGRSKRVNTFHIQGRRCAPLIFLDGHLLRPAGKRPALGGRAEDDPPGSLIDDYISLSQVAAVEVYRGASDVPGEFRHPGSNCGVVVVWSRRGIVR